MGGYAARVGGESDVIFTSLPEPADVERVALGADGLIEGVGRARPISICRQTRKPW